MVELATVAAAAAAATASLIEATSTVLTSVAETQEEVTELEPTRSNNGVVTVAEVPGMNPGPFKGRVTSRAMTGEPIRDQDITTA